MKISGKIKSVIILIAIATGLLSFNKAKAHSDINYSSTKNAEDSIFLADPTIFFNKGTYYLYGTSSNEGFFSLSIY